MAYLPLPPGTEYNKEPRQDQLKEFYRKCDAWLFSSSSEGFGLPILEAMACGRYSSHRYDRWCSSGIAGWRGRNPGQARRPRGYGKGYGKGDRANLSVI